LSIQFDPFGLLVSAFISMPPLVVEGIVAGAAAGVVVVVFGLLHGLPFCGVACEPGLFEFTLFAFVLFGVFGDTGGAVVFGSFEETLVAVPVVAPFVPLLGAVFVTVLFVHCDGGLVVVFVVV